MIERIVEAVVVFEVFVHVAVEIVVDAVARLRLRQATLTGLEVIVDEGATRARARAREDTDKEDNAAHGRKHSPETNVKHGAFASGKAANCEVVRHF
jgi:hypothetical protein